jgi:hypothetical protein
MQNNRGRVLSGKYREAIESYFFNTDNYAPTTGINSGSDLFILCEFINPVFKDVMTPLDIRDVMTNAIHSCGAYWSNAISDFDFPPGPAASVLVQEIIASFARYPRSYTCEISIPHFLPGGLDGSVIEVAEGIRLKLPEDGESGTSLFICGSGYFGRHSESPFAAELITFTKIFSYICRAFSSEHFFSDGQSSLAVVSDDNGSHSIKLELPSDLQSRLESIMVNSSELRIATNNVFLSELDRIKEVKDSLFALMGIVDLLRKKENARIVAAIEWYEDSTTVENQTVALLEVCIGLEALLGQEEDMSEMTKRLCDRLAFTLGRTRDERMRLHAEYLELLKLRGKLVHAKIFRLRSDDERILKNGRKMLNRMINHEIEFLR